MISCTLNLPSAIRPFPGRFCVQSSDIDQVRIIVQMLCKLKSEESKIAQRSTYNCILTSEKREFVSAYKVKCLSDTAKIKICVISILFEKKLHNWRLITNNIIGGIEVIVAEQKSLLNSYTTEKAVSSKDTLNSRRMAQSYLFTHFFSSARISPR